MNFNNSENCITITEKGFSVKNDIEKEMDEENGFSFTKQKNCQNIIKHSNEIDIQPHDDESDNYMKDYYFRSPVKKIK